MTIGITWHEQIKLHTPPMPACGLTAWLTAIGYYGRCYRVTRCSKCRIIPVYCGDGLCERCREIVRASKSRLVRKHAVKCKQRGCKKMIFVKRGYSGYCKDHYRAHRAHRKKK